MIDSRDKKTVDAFTPRRGRPVTGTAMTAAERMAAKRARDRAAINNAVYPADYADVSTSALIESLSEAVRSGSPAAVRKLSAELVKRAKSVEKSAP